MPIRILDKATVAQIAAGEVVERPASVVKELIENALDAGASQIAVEVRGGGVRQIRVMDNGSGMPPDEVALAFERHATSKLNGPDDLQAIQSLGFRGEALPSIAAVAEVEVVTCAVGQAGGVYVSLGDGRVVSQKSQARPTGTTVTVRNLFSNVPARLKFLKALSTESGHIANVVSQYALAYPEVGFTLFIDGRKSLGTSGRGQLMDSIIEVYGLETASRMLQIELGGWGDDQNPVYVSGMIGAPEISRSGRGYLSFFINRRWVSSRILAWAVEEAYHGLLPSGKHPVAAINISLPAADVDVNIHPAKSEVRFRNERQAFAAVQKAVRQTLVAQAPVPRIEEVAAPYAPPRRAEQATWLSPSVIGRPITASPQTPPPLAASLPALRVLGQAMGSYIVAEGPDGLYLIDQHAAHERIVFEKVREQRAQKKVEVQGLLEPVPFEVSPKQEAALRWHLPQLAEFGFALEPFGERTYLVRSVPAFLGDGDWSGALRELLDSGEGRTDWTEKIAVSIACHSGAVKARQALSDDEMRELVRQLEKATIPHTCPHGRPTLIHLSAGQLRREFGRS